MMAMILVSTKIDKLIALLTDYICSRSVDPGKVKYKDCFFYFQGYNRLWLLLEHRNYDDNH